MDLLDVQSGPTPRGRAACEKAAHSRATRATAAPLMFARELSRQEGGEQRRQSRSGVSGQLASQQVSRVAKISGRRRWSPVSHLCSTTSIHPPPHVHAQNERILQHTRDDNVSYAPDTRSQHTRGRVFNGILAVDHHPRECLRERRWSLGGSGLAGDAMKPCRAPVSTVMHGSLLLGETSLRNAGPPFLPLHLMTSTLPRHFTHLSLQRLTSTSSVSPSAAAESWRCSRL